MTYYAYATPIYSSWEISDALSRLGFSHSIENENKSKPDMIVNLKKPQPYWFHITVNKLNKEAINILPICYSEIVLRDVLTLSKGDLTKSLQTVSRYPKKSSGITKTLTYMDYVSMASKPTALTALMTALYKVSPHQLRKEVSIKVFNHLTGKLSYRKLAHYLNRGYKTSILLEHIDTAQDLRKAFLEPKLVSELDISEFDLNYLKAKHGSIRKT
jgi:hypothetical protein